MIRLVFIQFFLLCVSFYSRAQTDPFQLVLPPSPDWATLREGRPFVFELASIGGNGQTVTFSILDGKQEGMQLDSLGGFSWTPSYSLADRVQGYKVVSVVFGAQNEVNERTSKTVEFKVLHVNRPPVMGELKPFYVQYNTLNTYQIDANVVFDEDKDPLVFVPITDQMPEGAKLSAQGEFVWRPSVSQFNRLKNAPVWVEFWVEDQPAKTRTKARLKIEATQLDLPPEISVVPNVRYLKIKEDVTTNLIFYLTDPNGESDIEDFSFVSDNPNVPKSALKRNTNNQYEFTWKPGYDFVKDPADTLNINITFFVLDKAQKRDEKRIQLCVMNTVNEREKDVQLFTQYRTGLVRAWELIEQLSEKQEELKRTYNRAKKGKKHRSVINASLGAVTGLAPAIPWRVPSTQKAISSVGGTTVLTMGALEATEVIGKSIKDLIDRLNYVVAKKNELQTKGDIFARKYNLKSARRKSEFSRDLDDFLSVTNLSGLVAIELEAGWNNTNKATDQKIGRMFKDFAPLEEDQ
jgi:hypothetical protein